MATLRCAQCGVPVIDMCEHAKAAVNRVRSVRKYFVVNESQPAREPLDCNKPEGHMGWLNCPTHNREITAKLALIGRQMRGAPDGGETRIRVLQAACDDYRDEVARLNQQIVDRDTTIMLEGEQVERLRDEQLDRISEARTDQQDIERLRMQLGQAEREIERLRADLNRANEHNRALTVVVTAAKDFIKAPRCVRPVMSDSHATCIRGGEPCDLYYWHLLKHSLAELDKAQQS